MLAIAALGLSSCSAPSQPAQSEAASQAPQGSKENDRGNISKTIGETAAFGSDTIESSAVRFKVMEIKPFECTREPDFGPGNGHMVAVTIDVETGKDLPEQTGSDLVSLNAGLWKGYSVDGKRMNTVSSDKVYNCVDDRSVLLPDLGPAEKATGIVLLDCPSVPTSLAFSFPQQGNSWEWEYPAQ